MVARRAGDPLQVRLVLERRREVDPPRSDRGRASSSPARAAPAPARRTAIARASSMSDAAGTTRATSPNRSASAADRGSESSASSAALAGPTRRGRNQVAPLSGTSPIRPNARANGRGLGHHPEVAGERERRAGAGGDAVDRADDRLIHVAHRADDRVVALAQLHGERRRRSDRGVPSGPGRHRTPGRHRSARRPGPSGPGRRPGTRPAARPSSGSSAS